jgi:hypothetical protein
MRFPSHGNVCQLQRQNKRVSSKQDSSLSLPRKIPFRALTFPLAVSSYAFHSTLQSRTHVVPHYHRTFVHLSLSTFHKPYVMSALTVTTAPHTTVNRRPNHPL